MQFKNNYFEATMTVGNKEMVEYFYVLPETANDIYFESENFVGKFNFRNRQGLIMFKEDGIPEALHFPQDFVNCALEVCPPLGFDNIVLNLFNMEG